VNAIEAQRIVQAYGAVLGEITATGMIRDLRLLPYTKTEIKVALQFALKLTSDAVMRDHLRNAYISLADFQRLTDGQIIALQRWDRDLASNAVGGDVSAKDSAEAVSTIGADVIAIQATSMTEARALLDELKQAGF
jgi:hypothetical protein